MGKKETGDSIVRPPLIFTQYNYVRSLFASVWLEHILQRELCLKKMQHWQFFFKSYLAFVLNQITQTLKFYQFTPS